MLAQIAITTDNDESQCPFDIVYIAAKESFQQIGIIQKTLQNVSTATKDVTTNIVGRTQNIESEC